VLWDAGSEFSDDSVLKAKLEVVVTTDQVGANPALGSPLLHRTHAQPSHVSILKGPVHAGAGKLSLAVTVQGCSLPGCPWCSQETQLESP